MSDEKIDVKIGSPEEVFWDGVKKKCNEMVEQCEHEIEIQKHILKLAEKKIKEESN